MGLQDKPLGPHSVGSSVGSSSAGQQQRDGMAIGRARDGARTGAQQKTGVGLRPRSLLLSQDPRRRPGGTTPGGMTLPTTPLQGSLEKYGVRKLPATLFAYTREVASGRGGGRGVAVVSFVAGPPGRGVGQMTS